MTEKLILILKFILGPICIVIGADKFLMFLEECTLQAGSDPKMWMMTGVLQILIGLSIIFDKKMNVALLLALIIFSMAIYSHISIDTDDIGGAIFLGILTLLLLGLNLMQKPRTHL